MIIVHDIFVCKPGNAGKLAKRFKEWSDTLPEKFKFTVMTDLTGQWHRVIMVSEHENLANYEEKFNKMMEPSPENRAMEEKFKDMNDMYVSGSREIYKVW